MAIKETIVKQITEWIPENTEMNILSQVTSIHLSIKKEEHQ